MNPFHNSLQANGARNPSRRRFLTQIGTLCAVANITSDTPLHGADSPAASKTATPLKARQSLMKLGTVTYNLAKDWDIETLIKNCEQTRFEGAELRTTHAHGVEVSLSKGERDVVKKRFANSKVALMGLGSAFDYHTPDATKLRQDIDATKEYMKLAHDLGAPGVKVRPNGLPKNVPVEKTLDQIGMALRELGMFGADLGVQIRLEVHGEGTSRMAHVKRIVDTADHKNVGVCWNSNQMDLDGGFDQNFDLVKSRIFTVHMRDLFLEEYPFRRLMTRLVDSGFRGFCLAEIPSSNDPIRVMHYYRALWLSYQGLL